VALGVNLVCRLQVQLQIRLNGKRADLPGAHPLLQLEAYLRTAQRNSNVQSNSQNIPYDVHDGRISSATDPLSHLMWNNI
jgi:hypothetical protein